MSGAVSAADAAGRRELQFALLQTAAAKFWLRNLVLGLKAKEEHLLLSFKVALPRDRKKTRPLVGDLESRHGNQNSSSVVPAN